MYPLDKRLYSKPILLLLEWLRRSAVAGAQAAKGIV